MLLNLAVVLSLLEDKFKAIHVVVLGDSISPLVMPQIVIGACKRTGVSTSSGIRDSFQ